MSVPLQTAMAGAHLPRKERLLHCRNCPKVLSEDSMMSSLTRRPTHEDQQRSKLFDWLKARIPD